MGNIEIETIIKENERSLERIFACCEANVSDEFMEWLRNSGYYTVPASTHYHDACVGGLFRHSMTVCNILQDYTLKLGLRWERPESPAIVGLFHDICKVDQYIPDPNAGPGDPPYRWNKKQMLSGHGEKSVILLQKHMKLTEEEILCIRYHSGAFEGQEKWTEYTNAIYFYKNVLYTHTADMLAAHHNR